jgi:DNA-binding response OmpR family regulator
MSRTSILVIEDDPALLRGLKDNFEAQGYRVHLARDGQEGFASALGCRPDLLVLDVMIPKMNGFQLCHALRARKLDFPIIILTAKDHEADVIRGLEVGADDYVTKPFRIGELLARVRAFLRRRTAESSTIVEFGGCKLDLAARKLLKEGAEIELTAKEFQLLEFFVCRRGRALTRDQILDGVWGHDIIVNDRSVDRCVTTLRAKIEPVPHHPVFIQTIRDIGYRFE